MVSPFAVHQQQLAFLSQQQALMMAATKSGGTPPTFTGKSQQPCGTNSNLTNADLPAQNWANLGYQMPGITLPGVQKDADKFSQVIAIKALLYTSYLIKRMKWSLNNLSSTSVGW